ncbi:HNH endonuclease [Streptomyces luteogriseus]|uniref:HNH endonuclease n=1 Tax=Streptomyces luteogriseus TaxID=68233 RepID=UPI0037B8A510
MAPAAGNPRNRCPYRRLVDWLRSQCLPCSICGHNIGYDLDPRHPLSFTLDHEKPLSRGGALLDKANARAAHRRCNSSTNLNLERRSRRW